MKIIGYGPSTTVGVAIGVRQLAVTSNKNDNRVERILPISKALENCSDKKKVSYMLYIYINKHNAKKKTNLSLTIL